MSTLLFLLLLDAKLIRCCGLTMKPRLAPRKFRDANRQLERHKFTYTHESVNSVDLNHCQEAEPVTNEIFANAGQLASACRRLLHPSPARAGRILYFPVERPGMLLRACGGEHHIVYHGCLAERVRVASPGLRRPRWPPIQAALPRGQVWKHRIHREHHRRVQGLCREHRFVGLPGTKGILQLAQGEWTNLQGGRIRRKPRKQSPDAHGDCHGVNPQEPEHRRRSTAAGAAPVCPRNVASPLFERASDVVVGRPGNRGGAGGSSTSFSAQAILHCDQTTTVSRPSDGCAHIQFIPTCLKSTCLATEYNASYQQENKRIVFTSLRIAQLSLKSMIRKHYPRSERELKERVSSTSFNIGGRAEHAHS